MRAITFVLLSFFLSSCSTSDRHVFEDSEGAISDDFFKTIKKNKTQKEWIIDNLGEPQDIDVGPNAEEVYSYRFSRKHYRHTNVFFIFRYNASESEEKYFHVLMCDEIVKKTWWDAFSAVQIDSVVKKARCKKHVNQLPVVMPLSKPEPELMVMPEDEVLLEPSPL